MWTKASVKNDLESTGETSLLYPSMSQSPDLRWGFIRKIYSIITIQLLATVAVSAVVVAVHPIADFFLSSPAGLPVYFLISLFTIILLIPLYLYQDRHPVNYLLLGIFTLCISFSVSLTAFTSGKVILEAAILTAAVVVSLTLYTFWAARRGHDFNFLGPFLFGALTVLVVFDFIQMFFPLGKLVDMIYGALVAIVFCGYIIFDTDNIIKRFTYDQYIRAAISLYLDIINLFLALVRILRAAQS